MIKDIQDIQDIKDINLDSIKGTKTGSASPCNIYTFKFKDERDGFMKLFINNLEHFGKYDKDIFKNVPAVDGLKYEMKIYQDISKINSENFLKYFGKIEDVSNENLDKLDNLFKKNLEIDEKNIICLLYNLQREDYDDILLKEDFLKEELPTIKEEMRYSIMFFKGLNVKKIRIGDDLKKLFENLEENEVVYLKQFLDYYLTDKNLKNDRLADIILKVLLQILITLHSLQKLEIVHNDLHSSNIFIKKVSKTELRYNINDKEINFYTEYIPIIYDFDRSYKNGIDNPLLKYNTELENKDKVEKTSQKNEYVPGRDICKVFHTFMKRSYHFQHYIYQPFPNEVKNEKQKINIRIFNDEVYKDRSVLDFWKKVLDEPFLTYQQYYGYPVLIPHLNSYNKDVRDIKDIINDVHNSIWDEEFITHDVWESEEEEEEMKDDE